jgi:hypothetical protein
MVGAAEVTEGQFTVPRQHHETFDAFVWRTMRT